jgi:hypothetical protein
VSWIRLHDAWPHCFIRTTRTEIPTSPDFASATGWISISSGRGRMNGSAARDAAPWWEDSPGGESGPAVARAHKGAMAGQLSA